jgi:hypothetical protein
MGLIGLNIEFKTVGEENAEWIQVALDRGLCRAQLKL